MPEMQENQNPDEMSDVEKNDYEAEADENDDVLTDDFDDFDDDLDDEDFEDDFDDEDDDDEPVELNITTRKLQQKQRARETIDPNILADLGIKKASKPPEVLKSEREADKARKKRAREEHIREINSKTPPSALEYRIYKPDKAGKTVLWGTWKGKQPRAILAKIIATKLKGFDGKGFTPGYYYIELINPFIAKRYRGLDSILEGFTLNIADDGEILPDSYIDDESENLQEVYEDYEDYEDTEIPAEDLAPKSHLDAVLQQPGETVAKSDLFLIMQEQMRRERELERQHYLELEKIRARQTQSSNPLNNFNPQTILQWIEIGKQLGIVANPQQQNNPFPTEVIVDFMNKAWDSVEKIRSKDKTADVLKAIAGIASAVPGIIEATKPTDYSIAAIQQTNSQNVSQKIVATEPKKLTNTENTTPKQETDASSEKIANMSELDKELLHFYASAYTNFVNALSNKNIPKAIKEHNARPETASELAFVMLGNSENNALQVLSQKKPEDIYNAIYENILGEPDKQHLSQAPDIQEVITQWISKFLKDLRYKLESIQQSESEEGKDDENEE